MEDDDKKSEEQIPLVGDRKNIGTIATNTANAASSLSDDNSDIDDGNIDGSEYFEVLSGRSDSNVRKQSMAADRLSMRLLAIDDDDDEMEALILQDTLDMDMDVPLISKSQRGTTSTTVEIAIDTSNDRKWKAEKRLFSMTGLCVLAFGIIAASLWVGAEFIGPPNNPLGSYQLIERQEGDDFFSHYTFYEGPDSVGSNAYINYVAEEKARQIEVANISYEVDVLDEFYQRRNLNGTDDEVRNVMPPKKEPFLYLKTAPTDAGPRDSIRLEGKTRFNRGLFIIDIRHMPSGCGTWPAFWLTDEANWPINGEIDIVEGVNFQEDAKTALHTSKGCDMFDSPGGTMTGTWDTAVGIPDRKTGIPDMTFREAKNCFVYDPHQWINQGCVAIDANKGSLGAPLNDKGGGVFVLEWDPVNRHIRTWAFTPHTTVPENLVQAIRTASSSIDNRIIPNPEEWPLPYGYFPIGDQTNCGGTKFRNMRLVLNTALCGSVAGNRFFLDCKNESKKFKTCNEYIKSRPEALNEAYWKIRGVYVYQREWEKAWLS